MHYSLKSIVCNCVWVFIAIFIISSCKSVQSITASHNQHEFNKPYIDHVLIHPPYNGFYVSQEHQDYSIRGLGDQLGVDVMMVEQAGGPHKKLTVTYKNDGSRNEDFYGWDQPVLAPFDGIVGDVNHSSEINKPGIMGKEKPGRIVFLRSDGVRVVYAHLQEIQVKTGDKIKSGQVVGKVGNNGYSWAPHVHIGAWKDSVPLQIRFDLEAMGRLWRARMLRKHNYLNTPLSNLQSASAFILLKDTTTAAQHVKKAIDQGLYTNLLSKASFSAVEKTFKRDYKITIEDGIAKNREKLSNPEKLIIHTDDIGLFWKADRKSVV